MYKILFFYVHWCEVCHKIKPVYQNILSKIFRQHTFIMIDLDQRKDLIPKFKIVDYPTFLIFDENKEIYRQTTGDLDKLRDKINSLPKK